MTLEQLELRMLRAGLTQPQVTELLPDITAYATTQAQLTITANGYTPPPVHYLAGAKLACTGTNPVNVINTTDRGRVTCGRCRTTLADAVYKTNARRAWKDTTP